MPGERGILGRAAASGRRRRRAAGRGAAPRLRQLPYDLLRERSAAPAAVEEVQGLSGATDRRRTAIVPVGGRDALHFVVQVDDGRARLRLDPLAEERVTATPDGEFVRETTLAALSDDPRRYAPLTPTVQLVALAVLVVALVAWFVLAP